MNMQDLLLVLVLIGVIVIPVLIATRIGNRKPQKSNEHASSPIPAKVPRDIATAKRQGGSRVAILPIKS